MKALTVRQPFASLIISGAKDVENRTWSTAHRGPLVIHAGMNVDAAAEEAWAIARDLGIDFPTGVLLGVVILDDIVRDSRSVWAEPDCFHWLLRDARPVELVAAKGRLGLWEVEL